MKSNLFFDYHLECAIDIAFIWDIPELWIRKIGKIIAKKVILTPLFCLNKKAQIQISNGFLRVAKKGVKITFFAIISPIYRILSSEMSHMKAKSILHSKWLSKFCENGWYFLNKHLNIFFEVHAISQKILWSNFLL